MLFYLLKKELSDESILSLKNLRYDSKIIAFRYIYKVSSSLLIVHKAMFNRELCAKFKKKILVSSAKY